VSVRALVPDAAVRDEVERHPLVLGERTFDAITEKVSEIVERKTPRTWLLVFAAVASLVLVLAGSLTKLVGTGIGEWGNNHPVGWAWDITGFVFWIGIGHAGTLISAILFLFRQKWRTSINRAAEAMTLFAVAAATIYPLFHVGRIWVAYWLFPVPNQMGVWPNFKSPLLWDVFAVSTYGTVSLLFWYIGLVPDLATLRDRAKTRLRTIVLGIFALGWRGSQRHWQTYEKAYLILAGLSTPLVLSVHTIVSFDFAVSVIPGWHTTIFPPYFVAGAVFSGFAMVVTLMVLVRRAFGLENLITMRHLENMNKIMLATGSMVGYAYAIEYFVAWYSGNPYERFAFLNRAFGPYAWAYWTMVSCNVVIPQLFWWKKIRTSIPAMFVISILVNVGMWFERFVIIVTSLHRDFLPSSWGYFRPTIVDATTFAGTIGLFLSLFMLFIRFLPMIAISEVKGVLPAADPHGEANAGPPAGDAAVPGSKATVGRPAAVVGWFPTAKTIVVASARLRDEGYRRFDAHTPFPVHGLDRAMGLAPSKIPWIVLGMGVLGAATALAMQGWIQAVDYPLNIAGKPFFSLPAYVPIIFELTVLFAAFGCFFGLWGLSGLPKFFDPVMQHPSFGKATDDRFFVSVDARDPKFADARAALERAGARDVMEVMP
jgi:Ni/Fe-hydrogenase subunit HybB-like protein